MGPVHGLVLRGGVPPRVQEVAVVGFGQVDTETSGLQAHQEHGCPAATEPLERARPVPGGAIQVAVRDLGLVEPGGNQLEETRELAEHQWAVAFRDDLGQLFEQRIQLGRGRRGLRVHQCGIQSQHAQCGQRLEDREAIAIEILQQPQDFGPLPLQPSVVGGAVGLVQPHVLRVLQLGRQLQIDVTFGAAQHEWADPRAQPRQDL